MYIGIQQIARLFKDETYYLTSSDNTHALVNWSKLLYASPPLSLHQLYVCKYEEHLLTYSFIKNMHLLCMVPEDTDLKSIAKRFPDDISLLLVSTSDPSQIYEKLHNFFNTQYSLAYFAHTLLEYYESEKDLQDIIDYSYRVFGNPVFVFDINNNLIAAPYEKLKELNFSMQFFEQKAFTEEDYQMANRRINLHNMMMQSDTPVHAYNYELDYDQLLCTIDTTKKLGHIVVSAIDKPFEPIDTEFLLILKKYVALQISKDQFVQTSRGFNYEFFLRDLLDHKINPQNISAQKQAMISDYFAGNMFCLVIDLTKNINLVNTKFIRFSLENHIPNIKTLIYNQQIIAIISINDADTLPTKYSDAINDLIKEHSLYIGASNCFNTILEFEDYYKQALHAINLGTAQNNDPAFYRFSTYYLEHMLNTFASIESINSFCHPKMKQLIEYDKKHNSKLAYTLYMYLINNQNLAATSDAMDMHRSSLIYRFKKITEIIGEDYGDYKERMYFILSYELLNKD